MTHIITEVLFTLDTRESGVKWHLLAPESTIAVSFLVILVAINMANLRSHFRAILLFLSWLVDWGLPNGSGGILKLVGNLTESDTVWLWVGHGLTNKELLSVLIALRPSLSVPCRHFKQDFHQLRNLSLFLSNSKHYSGVCHVSLFQLGKYFSVPLSVTYPPPPTFLANSAVNIYTFFKRQ